MYETCLNLAAIFFICAKTDTCLSSVQHVEVFCRGIILLTAALLLLAPRRKSFQIAEGNSFLLRSAEQRSCTQEAELTCY
jgi:hypothetical protein